MDFKRNDVNDPFQLSLLIVLENLTRMYISKNDNLQYFHMIHGVRVRYSHDLLLGNFYISGNNMMDCNACNISNYHV